MSPVSLSVVLVSISLLVAVSSQPTYHVLSQEGSPSESISVVEPISPETLNYELVPSGEYAVATVESELSILDYILSPITAVVSLGSTALSVVSWLVIKGGLVFLGMAIVIGFCGLTPYCTMTIEKPSFLARENINAFPYLEQLEEFFSEAYSKYQDMQNSF